jgi:hypothetical protein
VLQFEEYITRRKKEDRLNEFDVEKRWLKEDVENILKEYNRLLGK